MKILGIETSGQQFSLCLCDDEKLLCEIRKERTLCPNSRDGQLFIEVRSLLGHLGNEKPGAIAVSIGPGMFTSLRVGLSLAKGLNLAQGIPLVSVNTLEMIGMSIPFLGGNPDDGGHSSATVLVPVINAHRNDIYAAIYVRGRRVSDHLLTTPEGIIAKARDILAKAKEKETVRPVVVFVGPDAARMGDVLAKRASCGFDCRAIVSDAFMPSAAKAVAMALPRINAGDFDDPATLVPFYLKKTDAEINYEA